MRNKLKVVVTLGVVLFFAATAQAAFLSINAGADNGQIVGGGKVYNQNGIAPGNELPVGSIVQYIYAGSNGTIDPPDTAGNVTGDDVLIASKTVGSDSVYTVFDNQAGVFYHNVTGNYAAGVPKVYVRAWNSANLATATHYQNSTLMDPSTNANVPPLPVDTAIANFATTVPKPVNNAGPNNPAALAQSIGDGSWVNSGTINLTMTMSDPNNPDTLTPQAELTSGAFSGTPNFSGVGVPFAGAPVVGTISVNVAALAEGDYKWQARIRDAGNLTSNYVLYNGGAAVIKVDKSGPTQVVITAPASPTKNVNLNFTWTAAVDNKSGLNATPYYYLLNNSPNTDATTVRNTGTGTANLAAAANAAPGNNYLHVVAVDLVGNISAVSHSNLVVVDTAGPTMIFDPATGAVNVAKDKNVVITFSEPVVPGSFNYALNPNPGGTSVAWSGGNTVATISHNDFALSTLHTVTVNAVTDLAGNSYSGGNVATFTTVAPNAPTISSISWKEDNADNIKNKNYVYGTIEIKGSNFGAPIAGNRNNNNFNIKIDGLQLSEVINVAGEPGAQIYYWDASSIVCGVPLRNADSSKFTVAGNLVVKVTANALANAEDKTILVNPKVYGIAPSNGPVGTVVTFTGTAFGSDKSKVSATFNGSANNAATANNTTFTVAVPAGATTGVIQATVNTKLSNTKDELGTDIIFTVNDLPPVNNLPVAENGIASVTRGQAVEITLKATDADLDPLTYKISGQPAHGVLGAVNGNKVTYTADAAYVGTDTFSFKANDGHGDSNAATVTVTVNDVPIPAPTLSKTYNKGVKDNESKEENWVYVTQYNPDWSGTPDPYLNLVIAGSNFGEKALNGDQSAPAGAGIAVKPYGANAFTAINDDPNTPPDRLYWWSKNSVEIGIPDKLGSDFVVAGPATVKVTTAGGVTEGAFVVKPKVYGITGTAKVGQKVTINGVAFGTNINTIFVNFGAISVAPDAAANTTIDVTVPAKATSGSLSVIVNSQTSNAIDITVADTPILSATPTSLSFTGVEKSTNPENQFVTVQNNGKGKLSWQAAATKSWLSVSPASGETLAGDASTLTVAVNVAGLAAGQFNDTITITSNGGNQTILVSLVVSPINLNKPVILSINPAATPAGTRTQVLGDKFGATQGQSTLVFYNSESGSSYPAQIISWENNTIEAIVPRVAPSGKYDVKVIKLSIAAGTGVITALESDPSAFSITASGAGDIVTMYPNPVNAGKQEVTIAFNPGTATNIGVYIYDMTARLVIKVNTTASQIKWDGQDQYKSIVGDGAYLIRVINEDTKSLIAKGKLLVVKK